MRSIERDTANKKRFEFNCPFKCIEINFGESNDVLPELEWQSKSILWLDYDGDLNNDVINDIQTFCSSAISGSVLIVSVNAQPPYDPKNPSTRPKLDKLQKLVGTDKLPSDISEKKLAKWGYAKALRKIISNEIADILTQRNGLLSKEEKIQYQQLFNFNYADGAKMLTVGGIIYSAKDKKTVDNCCFDRLTFIRQDEEAYLIDISNLTYREINYLDGLLPLESLENIEKNNVSGVSIKEIEKYSKIYRYFPNFAETFI